MLVCATIVYSEPLAGYPSASRQWYSGWMDLSTARDFKRGDVLRLKLGGTAKRIIVRLLRKDEDPNGPLGIDGGVVEIPDSRTVEVTLQEDHANVVQISVHGGPNPWSLYPLGDENGPATLLSAERVSSNR